MSFLLVDVTPGRGQVLAAAWVQQLELQLALLI